MIETMDDLISRAAAIEAIGERPYNWTDSEAEIAEVCAWESHKSAIENINAADAAPVVHGRWIDEVCSECGQYVYRGDARNYCPNCGAKMDGERRDDDALSGR